MSTTTSSPPRDDSECATTSRYRSWHYIKFGDDIRTNRGTRTRRATRAAPAFVRSTFRSTSPATLATLTGATRFQASFPGLIRTQPHHYYQVYAQDEWKVSSTVTMNLGLRYERDTLIWNENRKNDGSFYPRVLPYVNFQNRGDDNNVSPRLGLAWDVTGDGRSVVRAGYGRLFNTIMNGTPGAEETTLRQTSISINNPSYPDPYQGRSPASFASTAPPNISIVSDAW